MPEGNINVVGEKLPKLMKSITSSLYFEARGSIPCTGREHSARKNVTENKTFRHET